MKKNTSKNEMILACATLVLLLFVFSPAMGDPQLSVAVSSSTPSVVYLADGAETVTVTLTATPTLTNNAGELIEHEEGDCGTTDYTYEWSPTPNISIGNGATYTLDEGIHVFNVTVTAINLCVAQIGGGNAIVEVKKKCNEKKSNDTHNVTVEIPDITTVTNRIKTLVKTFPYCSDASLTVNGTIQAIEGQMCCPGTENTYAAPVTYQNIGANIAISPTIQFAIPGTTFNLLRERYNPIRWKLNISYVFGPTITLNTSGTLGISGQKSNCGTCLNLNSGISGKLQLACQATVKGGLDVFEDDNWLHISTQYAFQAIAFGETSFSGQCSYNSGNGCPNNTINASANIGKLDVGIGFSTSYNGVPLEYSFTHTVFEGYSITN